MTEYKLKYGCNPNQNPARIHMDGQALPFQILNGAAGYINLFRRIQFLAAGAGIKGGHRAAQRRFL